MSHVSPNLGVSAIACAVVGMGTLFSACVGAPHTGIVLTVEMTGRGDFTLAPASLVGIVTAMLLNGQPTYETLRHRMLDWQALVEQKVCIQRWPGATLNICDGQVLNTVFPGHCHLCQ